jgi:phosphatidylserine/phosphatidylglycerophosphate/cardiolipin synthase-like enzyme
MKKLLYLFLALPMTTMAQTDILDARTNYGIDDEVTVTGIVTNDGSLGTVRYIQDGTAGIAIYPGNDWDSFDEPMPGDEITVTGVLSEFMSLLEVGPDLSAVTINSSGNDLPEPELITPDVIDETFEGELVRVEEAVFDNGGVTVQGNSTYSYVAGGQSGIIYVRTTNPLVGTILPFGEVELTGIISQFSDNADEGYQLLPRGTTDIILSSAVNIASPVDQINIQTTSFDLAWTTDIAIDAKVLYGLTPDLGMEVIDDNMVNDHQVEIPNLEPGTIYYAKVMSIFEGDTAQSTVQAYATVSNSSGDMLAYFVGSVDNSVATIEEAVSLGADMNDTIAAYIIRAEHTVDMAIYNINNSVIVDAINEANQNGVQVRYIAEGQNANIGIGDFDAGIPVQYREDGEGSGMHNKFIAIDADFEDQAFLLTGSTNLTTNNLVDDFNNLIIFQDQSITRGFRLEFNEMWGGDGDTPDDDVAAFGADKSIDTPKKFIVGGSPVEVYFSPSDNATGAISNAIYTAEFDLEFALLTFTRDELADAVIDMSSIFLQPRGIIEQTNTTGSEYENLLDADIEVYSHQGIDGQLHHKYCIIDHSQEGADPMVITGSHNWSSSAENINDENTVVVHDARMANIYYQEFIARWQGVVGIEEEAGNAFGMYPNPAEDLVSLKLTVGDYVRVINSAGQVVKELFADQPIMQVSTSSLGQGIYFVEVNSQKAKSTQKLIVR